MLFEWFGQRLNFQEDCDDGNTLAGDGCDEMCRVENFMATESTAVRSTAPATTLCSNFSTLSRCETFCLDSSSCACIWYGGGFCHLYKSCDLDERIPTLSKIESTWDETEFTCKLGNFLDDPERKEIRSTAVIFGVTDFNASGREGFVRAFDSVCTPPCKITILNPRVKQMPLPLPPAARRQSTRDTSAVFVVFKFTTSKASARAILTQLTSFVNAGERGLWRRLRAFGLAGIQGVIFDYPDGNPALWPKPAAPTDPGVLYRKVKYQCSEGNSYYSQNAAEVRLDNSSLCCGNRSQICYPQQRSEKPKCYVSSSRNYQCLAARTPFDPTGIKGVPYDERVHLYWKSPQDSGGYNVTDFFVERVPFIRTQILKFDTKDRDFRLFLSNPWQ